MSTEKFCQLKITKFETKNEVPPRGKFAYENSLVLEDVMNMRHRTKFTRCTLRHWDFIEC